MPHKLLLYADRCAGFVEPGVRVLFFSREAIMSESDGTAYDTRKMLLVR